MVRMLSLAVGIAAVSATLAGTAASSPARAGGSERVALSCVANVFEHEVSAGFSAPDSPPFWDIGVPPAGSFAYATGVGTFTSDNRMDILCNQATSSSGPDWGSSFTGGGVCRVARGVGVRGAQVKEYEGRAFVSVVGNRVVISCKGKLVRVTRY